MLPNRTLCGRWDYGESQSAAECHTRGHPGVEPRRVQVKERGGSKYKVRELYINDKPPDKREEKDDHPMNLCPKDAVRIHYANVGGIGEPRGDKDHKLQRWMEGTDAEVIGLSEVNYNWWWREAMPAKERARRWTTNTAAQQLVVTAHN